MNITINNNIKIIDNNNINIIDNNNNNNNNVINNNNFKFANNLVELSFNKISNLYGPDLVNKLNEIFIQTKLGSLNGNMLYNIVCQLPFQSILCLKQTCKSMYIFLISNDVNILFKKSKLRPIEHDVHGNLLTFTPIKKNKVNSIIYDRFSGYHNFSIDYSNINQTKSCISGIYIDNFDFNDDDDYYNDYYDSDDEI